MELTALIEILMQFGPVIAVLVYLLFSSEKDKDFLKKQLEDANLRNQDLEDSHKKETDSLKEALDNNTLAINNLALKMGGIGIENLRDQWIDE